MSGDSLAVSVRRSADSRRVEMHLEGLGEPIWWEWSGKVETLGDNDCDDQFAIMASLPYAMAQGKNIRFQGTADTLFLKNVEHTAEVWANWFPNDFKAIKVVCDAEYISSISPQARGGVFAFSGGVDSTYTLLQHYNGLAGRRNKEVAAVVCIHGLDFSYGEQAGFNTLVKSMDWVTTDLKIPLITVRTNYRFHASHNLNKYPFMLGIAASLHQLSNQFSSGIIAADFTYEEDYALHPYGSNAVTNALLSSSNMEIDYYGADEIRLEKLRYLLSMPNIASKVFVCQAKGQAQTGKNCGECNKCVRTMVECVANGYDPKIMFGTDLHNWSVWTKLTMITPVKHRALILLLGAALPGLKKYNRSLYYFVALRLLIARLVPLQMTPSFLAHLIRSSRLVKFIRAVMRWALRRIAAWSETLLFWRSRSS